MRLSRRAALAGGLGAALARPALANNARAAMLRFVPQADNGWNDPTFWPFLETRNHALMVYDTLYGLDAGGAVQPQMAEGHTIEDDGRTWRIRLRDGLVFHDGSRVLARDCIASIQRWGAHATMGETLLAATREMAAADDRTIVFRLAHRFPLLAMALGDRAMQPCVVMPAHIAEAAPFQPIEEVIGSGPYRYLAGEREPGRFAAYARHADYVPRPSGSASFTAGPKLAHFERIEWRRMSDAAALAALRSGEVDWWETPAVDARAAIAADPRLVLAVRDRAGFMGTLRTNHLTAPFNNPALRRAVLRAVDQTAFMAAASLGTSRPGAPVGFFCPVSPMASAAGLAPPDEAAARAAVHAAGGAGAQVTVLGVGDLPPGRAMAELGAALLARLGFAVTTALVPLRSLVPRLLRTQPAGAGGWSVVFGYWSGHDMWHPGLHRYLRAEGQSSEVGWPTSDRLEALRRTWLAIPDVSTGATVAADIQMQALEDVPYVPLGHWTRPTAYSATLAGMLDGFPLFWNLRRG